MTVTGVTHGIGELARLTGVPVRTIRYYSDEGLLPAVRSSGGHRRFTPETAEALRLIRRLRGLGLGLPAIAQVLRGERALAEAVSAERRALDVELSALAWRRASLRAVEDADPADRAARLDLLASAEHGHAARQAVAASMRRLFVVPVPESQREGFIALAAPDPPTDPTPRQVVAYAELVALTGNGPLIPKLRARGEINRAEISDESTFLAGLTEAYEFAAPIVESGLDPRPGKELDRFVEAHATGRGTRDTPAFRRRLAPLLARDQDADVQRLWHLVGEITERTATPGAVNTWFTRALDLSL